MIREQENMTMQLVEAVLARSPRARNFEMALTQVGIAYRELYMLVRGVDDEYHKILRELSPAPAFERRKRAKPYRSPGYDELEKPRLQRPRENGSEQPGDGRIMDGQSSKKRLDSGIAAR